VRPGQSDLTLLPLAANCYYSEGTSDCGAGYLHLAAPWIRCHQSSESVTQHHDLENGIKFVEICNNDLDQV
jgi:hypothetical protein